MNAKGTNSLCRDMFRVNGQLEAVMKKISSVKDSIASEKSPTPSLTAAIFQLENVLTHLRKLANSLFKSESPSVYGRMMDTISTSQYRISFAKNGDAYRLTLPCLLPYYKDNSKNVLIEPLQQYLLSYQKNSELPFFESAVFVVVNHTSQDPNQIRDNDNYEYKQLINTLAFWFLPDDGYGRVSMLNVTKPDKNDFTEVFIVPKDVFATWISANMARMFD